MIFFVNHRLELLTRFINDLQNTSIKVYFEDAERPVRIESFLGKEQAQSFSFFLQPENIFIFKCRRAKNFRKNNSHLCK